MASLLFASAGASAAENSQPTDSRPASRNPVRIQSQQLDADMNTSTAEFSGQVRATDDTYTVTADRLAIVFKPEAKDQGRLGSDVSSKDISKIIARGRVLIQSQSLRASSDVAEYEPDSGRATLWGEKTAGVPSAAPEVKGPGNSSGAEPSAGTDPALGRVRVVFVPMVKPR